MVVSETASAIGTGIVSAIAQRIGGMGRVLTTSTTSATGSVVVNVSAIGTATAIGTVSAIGRTAVLAMRAVEVAVGAGVDTGVGVVAEAAAASVNAHESGVAIRGTAVATIRRRVARVCPVHSPDHQQRHRLLRCFRSSSSTQLRGCRRRQVGLPQVCLPL